jgi:glycosyltransferase involved in cell wall biosynthesis
MQVERDIPKDLFPCSSEYQYKQNPYYIVAPDYTHKSAGIRILHQLCSALNQLGYEAYVVSNKMNGELWAPKLTEENKLAHYQAGKKPIVVYPEVVKGKPMGLGLPIRYVLNYPGLLGNGDKNYSDNEIIFSFQQEYYPSGIPLYIPIINIKEIDAVKEKKPRVEGSSAVYYKRYKPSQEEIKALGEGCIDLSPSTNLNFKEVLSILKSVEILYCYETSAIVNEARLCGCAVVLLKNDQMLKIPELVKNRGMNGLSWGNEATDVAKALSTVDAARTEFIEEIDGWQVRLNNFISVTQAASEKASFEECWPIDVVDALAVGGLSPLETASKLDRKKYKRVNEQYVEWQKKSTLREIDADIYAEYIASGHLPDIAVLIIHQKATSHSSIADTLDSVATNFKKASSVIIISEDEAPAEFVESQQLLWVHKNQLTNLSGSILNSCEWVLLIEAGHQLTPNALVEFALHAQNLSGVQVLYSDEDVITEDGSHILPNFKPDLNVELLRCTNYIGGSVMIHKALWLEHVLPVSTSDIYGFLLKLSANESCQKVNQKVRHISNILVHGNGCINQTLENLEFEAAEKLLKKTGLVKALKPLERIGTWLVEYNKKEVKNTTMVVPTGIQPGYMRQMLESLFKSPCKNLSKIILICNKKDLDETEYAIEGIESEILIKVIVNNGTTYKHSEALNLAVESVETEYVWVCDDDVEFVQGDVLAELLSVAHQQDVACVEPRLMSTLGSDARLVAGPSILGMQGAYGVYLGESQVPEEFGYFSKLQLTQDVSTVSGHCFLFKKSHWIQANGFDEQNFPLRFSVLDFCLKLNKLGYRHVWSPMANAMHQGGKSLQKMLADFEYKISYVKNELKEKENLLQVWGHELAHDKFYNRHLSLITPYDVESNIVIDWNPARKDRPRLLASPLTSGAGQYRVIEPLEMLQDASLIQSSVIMPMANKQTRVLQPVELIRVNPDTLILQHSVDDVQLSLIEQYKKALPSVNIVQMVDDLMGYVPEKHPSRRFQSREGHLRMSEAIKKSDSMIVTTEQLKFHYEKYLSNVKVIPNCLAKHWFELEVKRTKREKLRVGWIGAGQHQGDLEIINEVVKVLADKVDWVFMGMHTAEVGVHIKEFHPFVSISEYPEKMAVLDLDIAVAPLEDNFFNSCKSNLRLLEYGAMSWPVVCSDVFPYQTNNPPVIRVNHSVADWLAALNKLIEDESERLRLGKALNAWVVNNYTLSNWALEWADALIESKP